MQNRKSISLAVASAFALTGAVASTSLFAASDLASGYMVASIGEKAGEHKCGEAKCGADKKAEAKCGEKKAEAKCGEKKAEAKCGEKKAEAKCGDDKKKAEH